MMRFLRPDMLLNYIFVIAIVATFFVGDSELTRKICMIAIGYVLIKPVLFNLGSEDVKE